MIDENVYTIYTFNAMQDSIKRATLLLFLLCFFAVNARALGGGGGSEIGNGGDTLYCSPAQINSFSGYYTLDYLLEYHAPENNSDNDPQNNVAVEVASFEESKTRLSNLIKNLYPAIYSNFSDYIDLVENTDNLNAARVWIPKPLGLEYLSDQNITRNLPENCLNRQSGTNMPQITQTVIRKMWGPSIQYEFDPTVLNLLKSTRPLQYSFFMVHEWLWDITDQVDSIRKINWLLHLKRIEEMSPSQFQTLFKSFELFDRKLNFCQKSEALKNGYQRIAPVLDCQTVTEDNLRAVKALDLSNLSIRFPFRVGDFYGFDSVETLNLSQNPSLFSKIYPGLFKNLYSLRVLNLSNCNVEQFSADQSQGLNYLEELNLIDNPLSEIGDGIQSLHHLKKLHLSIQNSRLFSSDTDISILPISLENLELKFDKSQQNRINSFVPKIQAAHPQLNITIVH